MVISLLIGKSFVVYNHLNIPSDGMKFVGQIQMCNWLSEILGVSIIHALWSHGGASC